MAFSASRQFRRRLCGSLDRSVLSRTYRDKCLGAPADSMKRRISLDKRCERSFGCSINSDGAAAVQHQAAAAVQRRNLITSDGALRLVIKIVEIPTLTCAVQDDHPMERFGTDGVVKPLERHREGLMKITILALMAGAIISAGGASVRRASILISEITLDLDIAITMTAPATGTGSVSRGALRRSKGSRGPRRRILSAWRIQDLQRMPKRLDGARRSLQAVPRLLRQGPFS